MAAAGLRNPIARVDSPVGGRSRRSGYAPHEVPLAPAPTWLVEAGGRSVRHARNAIRAGVPERVVMELGGWRSRSVFDRYNVTSENDLREAQERASRYVAERGAETPKVRPLRAAPAQNPHNPAAATATRRRKQG